MKVWRWYTQVGKCAISMSLQIWKKRSLIISGRPAYMWSKQCSKDAHMDVSTGNGRMDRKQWWHWAGDTVPTDRPAKQHLFTAPQGPQCTPACFHIGSSFSESALSTASTRSCSAINCSRWSYPCQLRGCRTSLTLAALAFRHYRLVLLAG